jgi:curved DNA-binding protein CbpA
MQARDPHGYYAQLGVAHTASAADIKKAFRRRAIRVHPDRNTSAAAEETFKQLIHAYEVLRNPVKRAAYDAQSIALPPSTVGWGKPSQAFSPIVCAICKRVPIQPRYVIFYETISVILTTFRTPIQGVYCQNCADKRILRATIITWLFGWWGIPWGPIYTLHALIQNFIGGNRPAEANARILGSQAQYFASVGKMFLARSLATMALELSTDSRLLTSLKPFLSPLGERKDRRLMSRLKYEWQLRGSTFFLQSVFLVSLILVGMLVVAGGSPLPQSLHLRTSRPHEPPGVFAPSMPEKLPDVPAAYRLEAVSPRSSIPAPLQEQTLPPSKAWHITANSLRLRAGPGLDHPVIGALERFETVTVTGQPISGNWLPVQTATGLKGFVFGQYLTEGNGTVAKQRWCQDQQDTSSPGNSKPGATQREPRC